MAIPKQICRLCLDIISDNFEILDLYKVEMLKKVSLNQDLMLTNESVICFKCRDALQKSYDFKMTCLRNEKLYLETYVNCYSNVKREEESVCRFCVKCLDNDSFAKFNVDEDTFLKEMLDKCLPEIDQSTNHPLICYDCLRNCENMFSFVTIFLNNERKTNKHVEFSGVSSISPIDLNDASKFISDVKNDDETIEIDLNVIKDEPFEGTFNTYNSRIVVNKVEAYGDIENDDNFGKNLDSTSWEMKEEKFEPLEDYEINIKSVDNISGETKSPLESNSMQEDTALTNRNSTNVKTHKCTKCSYTSKYKRVLQRHMVVHEDQSGDSRLHKCTECSYQSPRKASLRKHLLVHKAVSEGQIYSCSHCSYGTKNKEYLRRHTVEVHGNNSKLTVHKCTECGYESRHRCNFEKHLLIHSAKDNSDLPVYKCTECSYETKHKHYLHAHLRIHKDNSEVPMHKCTQCSYESKHKHYLQRHLLTHKTRAEGETFKCLQCDYETVNKNYLRRHVLVHCDHPNVPIYKCTECSYESRHKGHIQSHLLIHKDKSEITVHKCTECNYESKYKSTFQKHLLTHATKDNSDSDVNSDKMTLHKCTECSFESKYKRALRRHKLTHMDLKNAHKCTECSYRSQYKSFLRRHMAKHKKSLE